MMFEISNYDEMLEKFKYCSMGNSQYQDYMNLKENLTPERMYRAALLNWHSKAMSLNQCKFNMERFILNIKEKKITIADFEKEISEAEGTQRDLLVVGKKRLELDLEELEQNKKLQAPLVKDAIEELVFYDSQIKKIEAMGLNPNFEEAEQEYHKTKVLRMARADKIARALGVDRGTIEYADKCGADLSELLQPDSLIMNVKNSQFTLSLPLKDKQLALIQKDIEDIPISLVVGIPKTEENSYISTNVGDPGFQYPTGMKAIVKVSPGETMHDARNSIVECARELKAEYILFLDDDIMMPATGLLKLYNAMEDYKMDIVTGYYYHKSVDKIPVWAHLDESGKCIVPPIVKDEFINCNWMIPSGVMLVKTSVFDRIDKPYFNSMIENNRVTVSDDCYFVRKCFGKGIHAYIHPEVNCGHVDMLSERVYWGTKVTDLKLNEII